MCTIIDKEQKPLIAKEDMIVYKGMLNESDKIITPYELFEYNLGELYKTKLTIGGHYYAFDDVEEAALKERYGFLWQSKSNCKPVEEGFHSCKNPERLPGDYTIYECVIPKGSRYYEGLTDLIVSNQIKIVKKWVKSE